MWHHPRCPTAENWVTACGVYTQWNFSIHKEPGYGVCRKIVQLGIIILSVSEGQLSYDIYLLFSRIVHKVIYTALK